MAEVAKPRETKPKKAADSSDLAALKVQLNENCGGATRWGLGASDAPVLWAIVRPCSVRDL